MNLCFISSDAPMNGGATLAPPPSFVSSHYKGQAPSRLDVPLGSDFELRCNFYTSPFASVTWLRDGVPMRRPEPPAQLVSQVMVSPGQFSLLYLASNNQTFSSYCRVHWLINFWNISCLCFRLPMVVWCWRQSWTWPARPWATLVTTSARRPTATVPTPPNPEALRSTCSRNVMVFHVYFK